MLGKSLRILGSCTQSIQGAPIALKNLSPDTSKRSQQRLTDPSARIPAARCSVLQMESDQAMATVKDSAIE